MLTIYTRNIGHGVMLVVDQEDEHLYRWWLVLDTGSDWGRKSSAVRRARSLAGAIWGGRQLRDRWLAMI